MKDNEDFQNRKEYRRKKLRQKDSYKEFEPDDPIEKKAHKKNNELKKLRDEIEDEEWEDWDRYYNH